MCSGNISENDGKDNYDNRITNPNQLLKDLKEDYEGVVERIHKLQQTPDQVIRLNNMIMKIMYNNKVSEEEIELLLNTQREVYDQELLDKNPKEIHLERGKEEVQKYKDSNLTIIGYDNLAPEYFGEEKDNAIIKVVYYLNDTSSKGQIYEQYLLVKDQDNRWKIKGWMSTEEFTVVGD